MQDRPLPTLGSSGDRVVLYEWNRMGPQFYGMSPSRALLLHRSGGPDRFGYNANDASGELSCEKRPKAANGAPEYGLPARVFIAEASGVLEIVSIDFLLLCCYFRSDNFIAYARSIHGASRPMGQGCK